MTTQQTIDNLPARTGAATSNNRKLPKGFRRFLAIALYGTFRTK